MDDMKKLELLQQIKEYRAQNLSWRKLSIKMGMSEKWAYRFWKKNEGLLTQVGTTLGTVGTTPQPSTPTPQPETPSRPARPRRPRTPAPDPRNVGFLLLPEEANWLHIYRGLDPQARERGLALSVLESALIRNVEVGTTRFKPRDLRDTREILGEDLFKWAWKRYLAMGVIVQDRTSTAGRYEYKPLA